jgi:hypothetical protein
MSILSKFEYFLFSVLDCSLAEARAKILDQKVLWNQFTGMDIETQRDVRPLLLSPDGPDHLPNIQNAILLSEVDGPSGRKTLFVSSVRDGSSSMIYVLSKRLPGFQISIEVSRMSTEYPRNAMTVLSGGKTTRAVHAMKDDPRWDFWEEGTPLWFEKTEKYSARRIKDRLNTQLMTQYISDLGYGSLDEGYWISKEPAHLIASKGFRLWTA